ncbi:glutathione S-transferase [Ceratobasidium sp. AG-I]|nr:glutathione S-transferase [Ceratobasidium sp. AG-I]
MVSVKLYGIPMSTCTQRVAVVCNELGIDYELMTVDMANGEHKSPEYLENKQPFGAVPVLVDEDGTQLFESRAISRYLAVKYGKESGLIPNQSDVKAYGLFEQAASIEYSSFDPAASGLTFERHFAKMFGLEPNESLAEKHTATLKVKMDGYERILSKQKYLSGDKITLADLFHLPFGTFINRLAPEIMVSKPHVKRWWDDISARPSWTTLS